jgi:hypothetical protein
MLNPSGISLIRAYVVEGAYQYGTKNSSQGAHVSIVDSTSAFNIGGALTYTFQHSRPGSGITQTAHLIGTSLSVPLGDVVFLGGSAKFLYWNFENNAQEALVSEVKNKGFIFDAGLTIRPIPLFSLGLVGYNLANRENNFAPLGFGGGLCLSPISNLSILFDSVYERVYNDPTRDKTYWLMGGAEYNSQFMAFRLGGGRDGVSRNGYLSGGASVVSQVGAFEVALRQDIVGDRKSTFIGVSGRLFVPAP